MQSANLPLVSIITLNYNGKYLTEQLLLSLSKVTYCNLEVIVVDNGSTESIESLKKDFQNVVYVESEKNLGFAGGNNLGIKKAKGEYILLLNNDTEVEPGFMEPMINRMRDNPDIGVISPKIVYHYADDIIQFAGGKSINLFTGRGAFKGNQQEDNGNFDASEYTELAHGAAMLINRKVIGKIGLMPEFYFLYYEELDYCMTIKQAGYRLWYEGSSKVYHKESMTVGKLSPLKSYYMNRNRLAFLRRHAKGFQKYIAIIWFVILSLPVQTLRHILKRNFSLILPAYRGLLWNLNHTVQINNPKL